MERSKSFPGRPFIGAREIPWRPQTASRPAPFAEHSICRGQSSPINWFWHDGPQIETAKRDRRETPWRPTQLWRSKSKLSWGRPSGPSTPARGWERKTRDWTCDWSKWSRKPHRRQEFSSGPPVIRKLSTPSLDSMRRPTAFAATRAATRCSGQPDFLARHRRRDASGLFESSSHPRRLGRTPSASPCNSSHPTLV